MNTERWELDRWSQWTGRRGVWSVSLVEVHVTHAATHHQFGPACTRVSVTLLGFGASVTRRGA